MAVTADIALTLSIENATYDIKLSLAGGAPSDEAPFVFDVTQKTGSGATAKSDELLLLAIGDTSGDDPNLDVELSPPDSLLQKGSGGNVTHAAVEVKSGAKTYKKGDKKFE